MKTGEEIKKYRKQQNLTQVELAQKAGIAVNSLRLYEAGKHQPRMKQLQSLATALNVPLSALTDIASPSEYDKDYVDEPTFVSQKAPQMGYTAFYPTEKGTSIFFLTMPDKTVYINPNFPIFPAMEKCTQRISEKDTDDFVTLISAYYEKSGAGCFPPEIGEGIRVMLDLLIEKGGRQIEQRAENAADTAADENTSD